MSEEQPRLRGEPTLWTIDHFPNSEAEYNWQGHYREMRDNRRNPRVTEDIVNHVLSEGTVLGDPDHIDRVKIQDIIDGIRWEVVVAIDDLDPPALLSVFSSEHETLR